MTRTVLIFGLISGAILSILMAVTIPFHDQIGFERGEIIGYTSIVVSALLIFFGVRSYRDNVAAGSLSFGRGFKVGALIAVIASLCYVATWEVIYSQIGDEFTAKYSAHLIEKARASGASQAEIDKKVAQLQKYAELYKNPAINAAVTLIEPLPIGLLVALISAAVLRRREGAAQSLAPV